MSMSVGVDVIEVSRVARFLAAGPENAAGVFTARELAYCGDNRRSTERLAARFAAKEAVLKAIGTGLGPRMRWTDVEVVNDVLGRPSVNLRGEVEAAALRNGLDEIQISMSHSGGLAIAQAVAFSAGITPTSAERKSSCASI